MTDRQFGPVTLAQHETITAAIDGMLFEHIDSKVRRVVGAVASGRQRHEDGSYSYSAPIDRWIRPSIDDAIQTAFERTVRLDLTSMVLAGDIDPVALSIRTVARAVCELRLLANFPALVHGKGLHKRKGTTAKGTNPADDSGHAPTFEQDDNGEWHDAVSIRESIDEMFQGPTAEANKDTRQAQVANAERSEFIGRLVDPARSFLSRKERARLAIVMAETEREPTRKLWSGPDSIAKRHPSLSVGSVARLVCRVRDIFTGIGIDRSAETGDDSRCALESGDDGNAWSVWGCSCRQCIGKQQEILAPLKLQAVKHAPTGQRRAYSFVVTASASQERSLRLRRQAQQRATCDYLKRCVVADSLRKPERQRPLFSFLPDHMIGGNGRPLSSYGPCIRMMSKH